jgi:hypothetical protein
MKTGQANQHQCATSSSNNDDAKPHMQMYTHAMTEMEHRSDDNQVHTGIHNGHDKYSKEWDIHDHAG